MIADPWCAHVQPVNLQAQDAGCTPLPVQSAAPTPLPTAKPALVLQRQSVSFNARNGLPARPHSNLAPASGCSSNVLYAVIALLGDLDESSLYIVKAEVNSVDSVASNAVGVHVMHTCFCALASMQCLSNPNDTAGRAAADATIGLLVPGGQAACAV